VHGSGVQCGEAPKPLGARAPKGQASPERPLADEGYLRRHAMHPKAGNRDANWLADAGCQLGRSTK
jgi:hypothetical protein